MARSLSKLADMEAQYVRELTELRKQLVAELESVEQKLKMLGSTPKVTGGRKTRRRRGGKTLREFIEDVLAKHGQLSAKEIEKAVLDAGYVTSAKNLYIQILAAIRNTSTVKRIRRGVYALASAAPASTKQSAAKKTRKTKKTTRKSSTRK